MKRLTLGLFMIILILCLSGCMLNVEKQREASYEKAVDLFENNRDCFEKLVEEFDNEKKRISPWPWHDDRYMMEPSRQLEELGVETVFQISTQYREILAFQLKNRMMGVALQGIMYLPLEEQDFENLVINKIEGYWYYYYEKN